jgi:hypothetical protein
MVSIGTSLSLMIDTKECRSSRGVQPVPMPCLGRDRPERAADVRGIQRRVGLAGEDKAVILPQRTRREPFPGLACTVLAERVSGQAGKLQRAPGLLGLGVAIGTHRPPDAGREPLVIEPGLGDRPPFPCVFHPGDDVGQSSARASSVLMPDSRLTTT